jgi:hypothetical protein
MKVVPFPLLTGVPMSESPSASGSPGLSSSVDLEELSGLDRIASAYAIGDHSVVVETTDGREIRITAWYDRARNRYVTEYERRSVVKSGGHDLRVWAQTPAYKRCTADDAASCLEAAVLEVDRINIY